MMKLLKRDAMIMILVFFLAGTTPALAQEQPPAQNASDAAVTVSDAPATEQAITPQPMMQGMKHGGQCGMHGKGKHQKHAEVVKRLDMIEARLAKIEAMLESLVRR